MLQEKRLYHVAAHMNHKQIDSQFSVSKTALFSIAYLFAEIPTLNTFSIKITKCIQNARD